MATEAWGYFLTFHKISSHVKIFLNIIIIFDLCDNEFDDNISVGK